MRKGTIALLAMLLAACSAGGEQEKLLSVTFSAPAGDGAK
jgi:uncharacterized lipoprotein YmbA